MWTDKAENFLIADWLAKYTAEIRFLISALSRGLAVVQSSDNAVMSASMTNRPKPVSAAQTMTESFNEHTVQAATWTH